MNRATDFLPEADLDKELDIRELVREFDQGMLLKALRHVLGRNAGLKDAGGSPVLGDAEGQGAVAWPVCGELEPLGYVHGEAAQEQVEGAARLVELAVHAAMRYQKAAALHLHAVREDYLELQRRHAALEESEARYRLLTLELEQRVRQQVEALEIAQRQLYQAEKLRSIGQLAAGVAHEINNPIGFVKSNLTTAQSYVSRLAEFAGRMNHDADGKGLRNAWLQSGMDEMLGDFAELLSESLDGIERVARIVIDLKGFSRIDRQGIKHGDVNEIVRGVCNVAGPQLGGQVRVVLDLAPVPLLRCDAAALGQVIYNLLANAAEAVRGTGTVRIVTHHEADEILVRVEDDGLGIAPEILPRIFEPFFTTKPVGQGTGLGLTLSADVVRAHGGRMEASSDMGKGSVIKVFLPVKAGTV